MIYRKSKGSSLLKKENIFYLVRNNDVYQINETCARIFDLCDGRRTKKCINSTLMKFYNETAIETDIEEVLCFFESNRLIKVVDNE